MTLGTYIYIVGGYCRSFVKNVKCEKIIWPRPGARNGSQQQKTHSGASSVYRDRMIFLTKLVILLQQDAIGGKQGHQQ